MTIDVLRAHKRELLARKKYEQELLGRGEGDELTLCEVEEELLDINAQMRALTGKGRKRSRDTRSVQASDRQQFLSWQQAEQSADEEIEAGRRRLCAAAADSLDTLSFAQRQTLELYTAGLTITQIAQRLGVRASTASRNLSRARKNAAEATARAVEGQRLMDGADSIDMTDTDAMRAVVLSMTTKQLVYFYLYYSEGLTLREIKGLVGTDHAAVSRTIHRARLKLDRLFGGASVVVDHPEALDEAAYLVYCRLEDHPEELPEQFRSTAPTARKMSAEWYRKNYQREKLSWSKVMIRRVRRNGSGKLLALLRERASGARGWLEAIFRRLKQLLKGDQ